MSVVRVSHILIWEISRVSVLKRPAQTEYAMHIWDMAVVSVLT